MPTRKSYQYYKTNTVHFRERYLRLKGTFLFFYLRGVLNPTEADDMPWVLYFVRNAIA